MSIFLKVTQSSTWCLVLTHSVSYVITQIKAGNLHIWEAENSIFFQFCMKDFQNVGDNSSENHLYIWDTTRNVKAALFLNFEQQKWLSKLLLKMKSWIFIICSLSLVSPVTSRYLLFLFPRLWVLRDQRQGQHQCEADLRAPGRHHLWKDVWEPGRWRSRRHGGQTGAPADRAACSSSPGLCMLKLTTAPFLPYSLLNLLLLPPLPLAGPQGLGSILHHPSHSLSCFFL